MSSGASSNLGLVSLVGAGPGDPELLTLKGLRRLKDAEAVVHDRLIGWDLLGYCRQEAVLYDVGKMSGTHSYVQQEEINQLLVSLARDGNRVVRLKGGDPFVFGRGGEEIQALSEAGVRFEVVPGVTSAIAAPAAVGIPVTHRGLAPSFTVATGHDRFGAAGDETHDWEALARMRGTLVFLMAVGSLDRIVERLIQHGRPAEEPAAIVRWATTSEEQSLFAPLREIATAARSAGISPPAVLVVGATVGLVELTAAARLAHERAVQHTP